MRPACTDPATLLGAALGALLLLPIAPRGTATAPPAAGLAPIAASAPTPAAAAELERQACTSCHLGDRPGGFLFASYRAFQQGPAPRPDECARCHVNNALAAAAPRPAGWLPLSGDVLARVRTFHAYVESPALVLTVETPAASGERRRIARFDACGLEQFLAAPLPRSGAASQSMYPVEPAQRRALLDALAPDLAPCEARTHAPAERARGAELYTALGCAGCHSGGGGGPRLRLGLPLLAREYVRARVRLGSSAAAPGPVHARRWHASGAEIAVQPAAGAAMPAHPELSDADLDALHAYLSTDRSDVPTPAPRVPPASIDVPESIRLSLYREVQRRVFDGSCRHCHSDDPDAQGVVHRVFGAPEAGVSALALPVSRLSTPAHSPALRRVLEPGPDCADSQLVARLREREREWRGERAGDAARGMPLTLPPLPDSAIRLVEIWTAAGCPSDAGDLCTACAPRTAAAGASPQFAPSFTSMTLVSVKVTRTSSLTLSRPAAQAENSGSIHSSALAEGRDSDSKVQLAEWSGS